ncbi:uncharacterized protein TNCT_591911 [Trichonephila clavata]|uniref:Mutator-like transposase domain-containing protein n=1 Tax=Trichonephila clavata TaxID=2740835 RepID=A0A8X6GJE7_TRICU|nr:uncharacterized protein TNCT_591911 [Trichonephila clavata]
MNVTYMSKYVFASCERTTGTILDACVESNLTDFINEEKRLSQSRQDIDTDGYYCLTAVVDGGWCKRSYGHGYNASSGVAVIIGMATKKIIFIGIRNKICLICQAIEASRIPDKNHICYKNWNGSSTGMESDIIVEGVQFLETVHHIRCTRIVADGDSNIISSIQEKISYGGRVLKVECANHAVTRFGRALDKLQRDTKRFSGKKGIEARKVFKKNMHRIICGARAIIKDHAIPINEKPTTGLISALACSLRNLPNHMFGKHDKCNSSCNEKSEPSNSDVLNVILCSGMLNAIHYELDRTLVSCCDTLLWNSNNNLAESFMNQFCKTSGGKRVDHSKAGSIVRRAKIAALSFQNPA